jgi:uncharacterized membrane protein YfcA
MTIEWMNPVAGFGVGMLVGITGVGGGSLMTPILVLLFGVAPAAAVGTDLWFAAITKLVGGTVHNSRGSVDWQVMRRLSLGSIPAAVLTLWWLHASGASQMKQGLIISMLGVVLLLTALAMLLKKPLHAIGAKLRTRAPDAFHHAQPIATVLAGALLGFLVSLTSVGAGALGTVMLLYLYPFRMTPTRLVGTDIVHAIPLTMVAGTGHLLMGNVDLALLAQLLLGSIPGIVMGSLISARMSDKLLRAAIAVILVAVGVKLLLS